MWKDAPPTNSLKSRLSKDASGAYIELMIRFLFIVNLEGGEGEWNTHVHVDVV